MSEQHPTRHTPLDLLDKYVAAINEVWRKAKKSKEPDACPVCGTNEWSVGDLVDVPVRFSDALRLQRGVYVYVPIGCLNCGYTMFFHSGTLDRHAPEPGSSS